LGDVEIPGGFGFSGFTGDQEIRRSGDRENIFKKNRP
jgi:hypothetical protein